jgi:hypothetical protein
MSNELVITGAGDALTVYVVVRRKSDSKVWDVTNSTWATWSDGSIGDYDTALSAKSGDLYQGDFPSAISSNTSVLILYYSQLGGSPAITDTLLLTVDTNWNGAELAASSSVALDSRALTTLNTVKRRLGITASTHDTVLTEFINQASDKIERILGRRFAAANYNEWLTSEGGEQVQVRNFPIIRTESVRFSRNNAIDVDYSGSDIEARISVEYDEEGQNGNVRLYSLSAAGTSTGTDIDHATYPTISTIVTQINTISGWTATQTATTDTRADTLYPITGFDAKNQTATLENVNDFDNNYRVSSRLGLITFRSFAKRQVRYRGGYESIPDDISAVCAGLVSRMFNSIGVNAALQSESIPDYSYSLASGTQLNLDEEAALLPYRQYVVGVSC